MTTQRTQYLRIYYRINEAPHLREPVEFWADSEAEAIESSSEIAQENLAEGDRLALRRSDTIATIAAWRGGPYAATRLY